MFGRVVEVLCKCRGDYKNSCGQFVDRIFSTAPLTDVRKWKRMQKRRNSLVAATFEKANTYVFAAPIIRDREVGGSNPLAPTINSRLRGIS